MSLLLVPAGAAAVPPPVTITLEPVPAGSTRTAVARVANGPGKADTWILNANVLVRNNSGSPITWSNFSLSIPGDARPAQDVSGTIAANDSRRVQVAASFTGTYPLPSVSGAFKFSGFDQAQRTFTLADMKHATPSGAYYLPFKASDLPEGAVWTNGESQTDESHHYEDPSQVFAYDVSVVRPNGTSWSKLKAGTDGTSNSDFLVYNLPIYAPDDGTILECRFSKPNLAPGTQDKPHRFGNAIWLRTGTGEVMGFAHLKQNSIPASLCPVESKSNLDNGGDVDEDGNIVGGTPVHANPVKVKAGQLIGRVGNSGATTGPHTHFQVNRYAPLDVDDTYSQSRPGLPFMFHRFQAGTDRRELPSTDFQDIGDASPHALPPFGVFLPNSPCAWLIVGPNAPEGAGANISPSCLTEAVNDLRWQGYLPTNLDGMRVGSKTSFNVVAKPKRPTTRAYANLSAAGFQSRFDTLKKAGYRLIDLDNYLVGPTVAFAGVWAKTTGPSYRVYHGVTTSAHESNYDTLTGQGFRPRVVSATSSPSGLRFSALYEKSGATGFVHEITRESKFQDQFDLRKSQGLRPLDVDGLTIGTTPYLSVTWDNKAPGRYAMRNAMPFATWASTLHSQNAAGRLTASLTGYQSGSVARYASIWRHP